MLLDGGVGALPKVLEAYMGEVASRGVHLKLRLGTM